MTVLVFKNSTSGPIQEPEVGEISELGHRVTLEAQKIYNRLGEENIPTTVKPAGKDGKFNHKFMPFFIVLPVVLIVVWIFSHNQLMMR